MTDDTKNNIIIAAMNLIAEKGYSVTTTKDIAQRAGVNEVTLFRKFGSKKGIVLCALKTIEWLPKSKKDIFEKCRWSLNEDLRLFADIYYSHFTKQNAKIIMGLRDPQIFPDIKEYVFNLPNQFKVLLKEYFRIMYEKEKISCSQFDILAGMFISINFGFILSKAYFDEKLIPVDDQKYLEESISIFAKGIMR